MGRPLIIFLVMACAALFMDTRPVRAVATCVEVSNSVVATSAMRKSIRSNCDRDAAKREARGAAADHVLEALGRFAIPAYAMPPQGGFVPMPGWPSLATWRSELSATPTVWLQGLHRAGPPLPFHWPSYPGPRFASRCATFPRNHRQPRRTTPAVSSASRKRPCFGGCEAIAASFVSHADAGCFR